MFDPVHLLKNFRNNWLNKKDELKTIEFYEIVDGKCVKNFARFSHLWELLKESENSPLTVSSKITLKSLVPSSMEKKSQSWP